MRLAAVLMATAWLCQAQSQPQPQPQTNTPLAWKPSRPVTLIVPFSPGGGVDATSRFLARELQRVWGQPVAVLNQPGADGLIGTRRATQSPPDGHTFLVQIPSIALSAHVPGFKGTDPVKELVPVSAFARLYGVIAVNAAIPGNTMADVVKYCKTAPEPCSFGTTENSAKLRAQQLAVELPSLVIANYKGGGQLVTDLVSNRVNLSLMGYTAAMPHVQNRTLKVVMTLGKTRSPLMPDVQSPSEAGFGYLESETWYGLFAPLGTSPEIVDSVAAAVREVVKDEALQKAYTTLGGAPIGNTPAEFAVMVREAVDKWGELARRFPIQ